MTPQTSERGAGLHGRLGDFALADVFRLIALSGKSGVLTVRWRDATGAVWFRRGEVYFARSDEKRELLGDRLVSAGKLSAAQLQSALEIWRGPKAGERRLGEILIDEGMIDRATLEAFVQEQIQDTVFDMFTWIAGTFDFEPIAAPPAEEDIGLSVSVENLVVEAARRLKESGAQSLAQISASVVYRLSPTPGAGSVDISLTPDEWRMLVLSDGSRSVLEVAEVTGFELEDVAFTLRGLFNAGLLELASGEDAWPAGDDCVPPVPAVQAVPDELAEPEPESEPEPEPYVIDEVSEPDEGTVVTRADEPADAPVQPAAAQPAVKEPEIVQKQINLSERFKTQEHTPSASMWAGLGDELTALTGAETRAKARATTTVAGEAAAVAAEEITIRRDQRVSRETLESVLEFLERS